MNHRTDEPRWFVVEACIDEDDLDIVSGRLWAVGVAGIEERPKSDGLHIVVSTSGARVDAVRAIVAERLVEIRETRSDEGLDGWRAWARPIHVGDLVIEPAWSASGDTDGGELKVRIDPGRAFGSGAHVTTRLALELLLRVEPRGRSVLDVGTGSGVLAVAAARLGARRVLGVDVDGPAREAARANAELNSLSAVIEITDASIDELTESFEVVVANVDASTLIALAPAITARLEPHGTLILSGLLEVREPEVVAAFGAVDFTERVAELDWVAIVGERE